MAEIAVIDSTLRKIDVETFGRHLETFSFDHLSLDHGTIDGPIDPSYDLSSYRALYVRVGQVTESVLDRAPELELVSTCGSGYDHVDVEAATERGVMVTHTPEAPAPGAVEHTFGFIFSLLCELPTMFERTANGGWGEGQTVVGELYDRTIGVVGLGTIGSKVAQIAATQFDANVVAYDPYVAGERETAIYPRISREEVERHGIELIDIADLFETASLVTMHVPLTAETERMVGIDEFEALEGGYFLNLSRGGVVDEAALIEAVDRDLLAGVALDVMETEPPESSNPLLSAPEVYVTPHIAGGKEGYARRSAEINAKRIEAALAGDRPEKVVNPDVFTID